MTDPTPKANMSPDMYQLLASRTFNPKQTKTEQLSNFGLGLAGEAGEVVEPIKKFLYHGKPLKKEDMKKELGDVLWYVSAIASICNLSLSDIMETNIHKLEERWPNGFTAAADENDDRERDGKEL